LHDSAEAAALRDAWPALCPAGRRYAHLETPARTELAGAALSSPPTRTAQRVAIRVIQRAIVARFTSKGRAWRRDLGVLTVAWSA
jgi:hypothetical protein